MFTAMCVGISIHVRQPWQAAGSFLAAFGIFLAYLGNFLATSWQLVGGPLAAFGR